jgi:hypothetical protein
MSCLSATGATDVRNMAYMTPWIWVLGQLRRLSEFMQEIEPAGRRHGNGQPRYEGPWHVLIRIDLVRRLSTERKRLSIASVYRLTPSNGTCTIVPPQPGSNLRNIDDALLITNGGRRARAHALKFWGDHQRFFDKSSVLQSAERSRKPKQP